MNAFLCQRRISNNQSIPAAPQVRCYSPCHIHAASVEIKCFNAPLEIVSDIGVQLFYFQICVPQLQKMLDLLCHSWFSV